MSDFTVDSQCPICKLRFSMNDGIPCRCLEPDYAEQIEEEIARFFDEQEAKDEFGP